MQRVRGTWIFVVAVALFGVALAASAQQGAAPVGAPSAGSVDYARDVEPILRASCYSCHAGAQPQAGLRLDVRSLALKGDSAGPIIIPGNSAESKLIFRVRGLGGLRPMPMVGPMLTPDKIEVLRRWVEAGARRVVTEGGGDVASRATYGFRLATSRQPRTAELQTLVAAFERQRTRFRDNQAEAAAWAGAADPDLAAWTVVANGLLNLDATITKE